MRKHFVVILLIAMLSLPLLAGDKMSPDDLIAKSLDAIAKPELRSASSGVGGNGTVNFDILTHGSGHLNGTFSLSSRNGQFQFISEFASPEYQGDQVTWDGNKAAIGANGASTYPSPFVLYLYTHPYIVSEGLFGGVLNNNWALYNVASRHPKLHVDGTKKYNGRQLIQMTYEPKKGDNDMTIKLYFDPTTYQHVATVCTFSGQVMGGRADEYLEENFSDFKDEKGFMLPHVWEIRYTGTTGKAISAKWNAKFDKMIVMGK